MQGLCLYTFIIGHNPCNMLSILNKLTLKKELQNVVTKMCFGHKVKTQQQQNKNSSIKNACRSRTLNPGHHAPKADALPLHH